MPKDNANTNSTEEEEEDTSYLLGYDPKSLIPPDLLATIPTAERKMALASAASARRAEERAEERALERAMEEKARQRAEERRLEEERRAKQRQRLAAALTEEEEGGTGRGALGFNGRKRPLDGAGAGGVGGGGLVFVSKKKREQMKQQLQQQNGNGGGSSRTERMIRGETATGSSKPSASASAASSSADPTSNAPHLSAEQIAAIKKSYLGESALMDEAEERRQLESQRRQRKQNKKKSTFKFEWDANEDTAGQEADLEALYGLGNGSGGSYGNGNGNSKGGARSRTAMMIGGSGGGIPPPRRGGVGFGSRSRRGGGGGTMGRDPLRSDDVSSVQTVATKPLEKMTARDWRIFRENYDITVKGGKAPSPLRSFRETPLGLESIHPHILEAIEKTLKYKKPSPIQRQAIPIGLQRRDLIGIAETGSGKTAAFGIPLLHYILSLPGEVHDTVAEAGPLALVMAPTRELALQIDAEFAKLLSRQHTIRTLAVVGGQPIQQQASKLRDGVHVVVGTPGRLNDCLEMAYLVLNQCSYVVLDEADRMIDLGFAPQIESILDAMGGSLKSEDETEAYRQEREDLERLGKKVPSHRLTAMFSATMPPEVERIAKNYLRHPAIVTIGDQDSGKNARIVQRVMFLSSPSQKERELRNVLGRCRSDDKVIVFVNEKKNAEGVGRMVERTRRRCVVLHGGKTQDQREENLAAFRRGGVVLVATDVAGRGLDIPDVAHVINYDVPSRSIDNYCHRIGRTGRAGKEGIATSFITDEDEGIMAPLKSYLESTGMPVPDRLARHPAAAGNSHGGNINF